jgi:predicted SnoaL-like aldol condensation-catalyzing enzyme
MSPNSKAEAIVRRFYCEVLGQGRIELADELFAAEYVEHQDIDLDQEGIEPAKVWFQAIASALPNRVVVIEDVLALGELVVARWSLGGRQTRPFLGVPPSNRSVDMRGTSVFRVENDRIVEGWNVSERHHLLWQLRNRPRLLPETEADLEFSAT